MHYLIGTSGYSFADWLGPFYPTRTRPHEMFGYYTAQFATVELNYTFYRMPLARTLARLAGASPPGFRIWVKANREFSHEGRLEGCPAFLAALAPLQEAGLLAGVVAQFPQAFHRTQANRRYLERTVKALESVPLAVEFRHHSWQHPAVAEGLRERAVTLVIPDVPAIPALYHQRAMATTRIGYLRLHSRHAGNWYDGGVDRYDYNYTAEEQRGLLQEWAALEDEVDQVYVFFNNCHSGQAAQNAAAFARLLGMPTR